ncbi:MAG TPA: histidine kinase N-terminal 7TM domain-containing protein, partial [Opitutales bacterium]|nr:histidine kinase N-terminal 7TM domain-containing protein [Opitutales bacterium]
NYFALATISAGLYAAGYGAELQAKSVESMLLASRIQYVGFSIMPLAWVSFVTRHTGILASLRPSVWIAFWMIPGLTILFKSFDGSWHFIYASVGIDESFHTLRFTPGPWYYFQLAYTYACGILATAILLVFACRRHGLHRRQALTLIVVPFPPLIASFIFQSTYSPYGVLDLTPFAIVSSILIMYFSVLRQKLVNLAPVAHGFIVEHLPEGILVFDRSRRLCEANESARAFLALGPERTGESAEAILGIELAEKALPHAGRTSQECVINGRDFEVRTTILGGEGDSIVGWIVSLTDIGERKRVDARLKRMRTDHETDPAPDGAQDTTTHP